MDTDAEANSMKASSDNIPLNGKIFAHLGDITSRPLSSTMPHLLKSV